MSLIDGIIIAAGIFFYVYTKRLVKQQTDTPVEIAIGDLCLEKINNIYYAYVGEKFVGQSLVIDELIQNMRDIHNVSFFNFDSFSNLSTEENVLVNQSLEKWYTNV